MAKGLSGVDKLDFNPKASAATFNTFRRGFLPIILREFLTNEIAYSSKIAAGRGDGKCFACNVLNPPFPSTLSPHQAEHTSRSGEGFSSVKNEKFESPTTTRLNFPDVWQPSACVKRLIDETNMKKARLTPLASRGRNRKGAAGRNFEHHRCDGETTAKVLSFAEKKELR